MNKKNYFSFLIIFIFTALFLTQSFAQKLGEKYLIFKPACSIPDAGFTYIKSLKKGYDTRTSKLSWDTYTEVNVVHIQDVIDFDFEVIKINRDGSVIIALNKPSIERGKEVIHEPRYLVKNFKEAIRSKELITRKDLENFICSRYPNDKDRLLKRETWVGMTEEQVYICNGKPSKISTYESRNGVKKQYEYPLLSKKIILEQGKVISIRSLRY